MFRFMDDGGADARCATDRWAFASYTAEVGRLLGQLRVGPAAEAVCGARPAVAKGAWECSPLDEECHVATRDIYTRNDT